MCDHGFIGACSECDGSGQIPETEEAREARVRRATRNWMSEHGERDAVVARRQVTEDGRNGPRLDRYSGPDAL